MLIEKYSSVKEVLEMVYRDTQYQMEIAHTDLIQWTVEAMDLMKYPLTYVSKVVGSKLDASYAFEEFRVALPCDFHKLQALAVNGLPVAPASNIFHNLMDGDCCDLAKFPTEWRDLYTLGTNTFSPQAGANEQMRNPYPLVTFTMNDSWVTFNIKKGDACMMYYAYPIDDDGFPLIPDNIHYKQAVQFYIQEKVDYILWRQGKISDKVFKHTEREKNWHMGAATNEMKMPSLEQAEQIKIAMTRLVPRFTSYNNFFRDLSITGGRI